MFGFRTPAKQTEKDAESKRSPTKDATQTSNVRRSIGEWEAAKSDARPVSPSTVKTTQPGTAKPKQKPTHSQEAKTVARRTSVDIIISPPKQAKYADKTAEARGCLTKAKLHLNNSKNLKTDIKTEVTQCIDRRYNIVKELEEEKRGRGGKEKEKTTKTEIEQHKGIIDGSGIMGKMEEHTKMLSENNRKLDELKAAIDKQKGYLERMTYANVCNDKRSL